MGRRKARNPVEQGQTHSDFHETPAGVALVRHPCNERENLRAQVDHIALIEADMARSVAHLISEHGATWQEIGDLIGLSRQGAHARYGEIVNGS